MIINYKKIDLIEVKQDPFPYLVLKNWIDKLALEKIIQDFPEIHPDCNGGYKYNPEIDSDGNIDDKLGKYFGEFLKEISGNRFTSYIETKFQISLKQFTPRITIKDMCCDRRKGHIHSDRYPGKIFTVLIYLNTDWSSGGGKLRLLEDKKDIENYFEEVEPVNANMVAFECTKKALHGFKPFRERRRMIQINWMADKSQRRDYYRHSKFYVKFLMWLTNGKLELLRR